MENVLAQVIQALDRAAAYHVRATIYDPVISKGTGSNTIEMWLVRGVGRRTENRLNDKLVSVVVENARWKLIWDPNARRVSAWPSELLDPKADWPLEEFMVSREKIIEWAKKQKASVVPQACDLDGRKAEKVTLTWPAESAAGRLSVWFEADSRRPIKLAYEKLDGTPQMEAAIDYPLPEAVPQERFDFQVPRDAEVEVFDPQFGREISSRRANRSRLAVNELITCTRLTLQEFTMLKCNRLVRRVSSLQCWPFARTGHTFF